MLRKNGSEEESNKIRRDRKKMDSEVFKELSIKISGHLELPEPKGMHLLEREESKNESNEEELQVVQ